jgi:O-antigen/teichoic acid export membrane protein
MSLTSTAAYTFFSVLIKMLVTLLILKLIARQFGTNGIAIYSQLQNVILMSVGIGSCVSTAMVRYSAEYSSKIIESLIVFTLFISISIACLSPFIFSYTVKEFDLSITLFDYLIVFFGVLSFSINNVILSYFNGRARIRFIAIFNSVIAIFLLGLTVFSAEFYGIKAVVFSMFTTQVVGFLYIIYKFKKVIVSYKCSWLNLKQNIDDFTVFKGYILMFIVTAIAIPLTQFLIRTNIIDSLGIDVAGVWQGIIKLSDSYLTFIIMGLNVYLLPVISSIKISEIKVEIFKVLKLVIPLVVSGILFVYFYKELVFSLLYSESFIPDSSALLFQLAGDLIRVFTWVFAVIMAAKKLVRTSIVSELTFSFLYVFISSLLLSRFESITSVTSAYMIACIINCVIILFFTKKYWFKNA